MLLCLLNPNTLKPAQAEEEPAQQAPSEVPGLICKHCDEVFLKLSDLRSHENSEKVTPSTEFCCSACYYKSKNSSLLKRHFLIHTGERPFKCDVCPEAFNHRSNLTRHKRVHTGERLFQCDMCPKAFKHNSNLKAHRRIHTGDKPFKCDICSRSFNQLSHLKTHEKSKEHAQNADLLKGLTPPPYCPLTPPPGPIQAATSDQAPDAEPNQYDEDSEYESDFYDASDDESDKDDDDKHHSKVACLEYPAPAGPAPALYPAP